MSSLSESDYLKLKVPELKELLKQRGLPVSGTKAVLVEKLLANDAVAEVEDTQEAPMEGLEMDEAPLEQQPDEVEVPVPAAAPAPVAVEAEAVEEPILAAAEPPAAVVEEPAPAVVDDVTPSTSSSNPTHPVPPPSTRPRESSDDPTEPENGDAEEAHDSKRIKLAPAAEKEQEEEEPPTYDFAPEPADQGRQMDMYLDTINRPSLDFDFERLCSVTLSHNNIYACLICGKYFQGRGTSSPAYAHAIAEDHHVYINLSTRKVYVLPDNYEVVDPSLDDIKYLLKPTFSKQVLEKIDVALSPEFTIEQKAYWPGFVGLNNIKGNSYMNVVIQSLLHVVPLRNYFLLGDFGSEGEGEEGVTELVRRFGMLCRKVWNPKAFKGQVSPHEFLQEVGMRSGGKFTITGVRGVVGKKDAEKGKEANKGNQDPLEFLSWLLNTLHRDLGGSKKRNSSIIYAAFQGEVRIDDQLILTSGAYGSKPHFDLDRDIKSHTTPFLFLSLDLPPPPLFQDAVSTNIIPQVPLVTLLQKYDGQTTQEILNEEGKGTSLRRYKIQKLPNYLVLHYKRFTKNNFVEEKNGTIVNFPLRGLDLNDYVSPTDSLSKHYDLLSNITHTSAAGTAREETTWKTHVHLRPQTKGVTEGESETDGEKWFEIQDLLVEEINRGFIGLGESYLQIWERKGVKELDVVPKGGKSEKKI